MINDLQNQTQASNREISEALGLGYRTLLRWRKRVSGGKPPLTPPGPKKTGPLPLEEVRKDIEALRHGPKRSRGSCALQARYTQSISRRAVADMVAEVRSRKARERRQVSKRVTWMSTPVSLGPTFARLELTHPLANYLRGDLVFVGEVPWV